MEETTMITSKQTKKKYMEKYKMKFEDIENKYFVEFCFPVYSFWELDKEGLWQHFKEVKYQFKKNIEKLVKSKKKK